MSLPPTHVRPDGRRVVVAAAVERDGRLLAARRSRPAALAGGWELPGGKVEPGEEPARALVRELLEELGVDAVVVGPVPGPDDGDWPLDDRAVLRVMRVRIEAGEPAAGVAHDALAWVEPWAVDTVAWLEPDVAPVRAAAGLVDSWVDFPRGAVEGTGRVVRLDRLDDGRGALVVDRTPFHPLDHSWPDQPGDTGVVDGIPVVDSVTGAIGPDGRLLLGGDVGVRRGDPTRTWVVVHLLEAPYDALATPGRALGLAVDADRRSSLSRGHSACHLAALALNEVSASYWAKAPARRDSRGFPYLDQMAITVSRIASDASYDAYRCGRSLRKSGFDAERFLASLDEVSAEVDDLLAAWVARGATSRLDTGGDPTLSARRRWICDLPGGSASIPCGGTHVADIALLGSVTVAYAETDDGFEQRTSVG